MESKERTEPGRKGLHQPDLNPQNPRKVSGAGPAMFNCEFRSSVKFTVMRQLQGEAQKATC